MGAGTDFWGGWGTSADDLSVFIITLSTYYEEYTAYIEDALTLLKAYNTDAGYDNYGANANSTALALLQPMFLLMMKNQQRMLTTSLCFSTTRKQADSIQ